MYKIHNSPNGKVLEHPTTEGGGMTSVLLTDITSVSYKELTIQKRKPNQEPVGKPTKKVSLIFMSRDTGYSIDCKDMEEAKVLYNELKTLM